MIAKKIFKFPDGNGGFTLQSRDAQGNWHPCDEDGNYLEEKAKPAAPAAAESTKGRTVSGPKIKTSLYLPVELYKEIHHYCIEHQTNLSAVVCETVNFILSENEGNK